MHFRCWYQQFLFVFISPGNLLPLDWHIFPLENQTSQRKRNLFCFSSLCYRRKAFKAIFRFNKWPSLNQSPLAVTHSYELLESNAQNRIEWQEMAFKLMYLPHRFDTLICFTLEFHCYCKLIHRIWNVMNEFEFHLSCKIWKMNKIIDLQSNMQILPKIRVYRMKKSSENH